MDGGIGPEGVEVLAMGAPSFTQEVPDEVRSLMRPGRWKFTRFGPNRWVLKGDGYMVRECAAFQLVAPSLRIPISRADSAASSEEQGSTTVPTNQEERKEM
jgi:hypothetical protein